MSEIQEWSDRYNEVTDSPPKEGDILVTLDGSPAKLIVEITPDVPPFIYGRVYVPEIVGIELGWFLQNEENDSFHGWKCVLMPRARADLIKTCGLSGETVLVKSLRVIRPSQSGKSLLCEVAEYCLPEEPSVEPPEEDDSE